MDIINLFDKDITLNAVLYILKKLNGKSDMHTIFKILYFADRQHLSNYGRTITGDVYIAMQYGPVPSKTDDIFKAIRGDSFFEAGDLKKYFHFINRWTVQKDMEPEVDYLSDTDVECLDYAIDLCKNKSFGEITEMSHGIAWESTARDTRMEYKDILREAGDTEEYAQYITDTMKLESSIY